MARRPHSERTHLLVLLAFIVIPATALITFSVVHLRSIQRDKAIEAAIQRDFQRMLQISEKRISRKVYDMVDDVQVKVPCAYDAQAAAKLDAILATHPYALHVFTWSKGQGAVLRSDPRGSDPEQVRAEGAKYGDMVSTWFDMEGKPLLSKMQKLRQNGDRPYIPSMQWVNRGGKMAYEFIVYFPISGVASSDISIGGIVFDPGFVQHQFLPGMMNSLVAENDAKSRREDANSEAVMMIHVAKEPPLAASTGWDGGDPEMERKLESVFPGLMLAIKFRGTTVEAIGRRFLRTSFLVLGGLSLLLAGGLVFTYRGVKKEMEVAKLKSDFVSNVSHELRTPLALIRLYAETLELGRLPNPDKQHEYFCTIRKESERLTALINNILDFSRIEAGRKEYEFRETNLPELVRATLESYRYQIEQQGFRLNEHIADDIPPLAVDREAIARSLLNLVNNAVKYSAGDRYVEVNLQRSNGSVQLEVVDHGIGIPRSEQGRIFEKFYRVCDPLVHNTKGSGLGLCLVRHIAHAHGGEISVESAPGKGSRFVLTLPVTSANGAANGLNRNVGVA
jgi:signal transduction histidine kinase